MENWLKYKLSLASKNVWLLFANMYNIYPLVNIAFIYIFFHKEDGLEKKEELFCGIFRLNWS